MFLLIDNSDTEFLKVWLKTKTGWQEKKRKHGSSPLLLNLEKILAKESLKLKDISGAAVLVGQGRFTATRMATVTVSALALALKIPVCALKTADPQKAEECLKKAKKGKFVSASYSAEAHISGQRRKARGVK